MVAELGIRFPPGSLSDKETHARRLVILAQDLADIPAVILAKAIDRYVRSPNGEFLPKASQLIAIAKTMIDKPTPAGAAPHDLNGYAEWLTGKGFSHAMGWTWFVGRRTLPSGEIVEFLDRR